MGGETTHRRDRLGERGAEVGEVVAGGGCQLRPRLEGGDVEAPLSQVQRRLPVPAPISSRARGRPRRPWPRPASGGANHRSGVRPCRGAQPSVVQERPVTLRSLGPAGYPGTPAAGRTHMCPRAIDGERQGDLRQRRLGAWPTGCGPAVLCATGLTSSRSERRRSRERDTSRPGPALPRERAYEAELRPDPKSA